jgi:hypothetical protein
VLLRAHSLRLRSIFRQGLFFRHQLSRCLARLLVTNTISWPRRLRNAFFGNFLNEFSRRIGKLGQMWQAR